jgi:hypothetical protein
MSFDKDRAVNFTNAFLHRWATQLKDISERASAVFEVFCAMLVILALERNGFKIQAQNLRNGLFIAKRSVWGDPNIFSFFTAGRSTEIYEVRQNQFVKGCHQGFYVINEDIVIMEQHSLRGTTVPHDKVIAFASCKHLSCFPTIIADFIGEVHELQHFRLISGPPHQLPPALLLTSGAITRGGRDLMNSLQRLRGYNIRIFGSFTPSQSNHSIRQFLATWQI